MFCKRVDLVRVYSLDAAEGVGEEGGLTNVYCIKTAGGFEEGGESDENVFNGDSQGCCG